MGLRLWEGMTKGCRREAHRSINIYFYFPSSAALEELVRNGVLWGTCSLGEVGHDWNPFLGAKEDLSGNILSK
jgi:hypothetical protein